MKILIYNLIIELFATICRIFIPVKSHVMVFESFPDYSDNSRALSEYLINNGFGDTHTIYWTVKDPSYCKEKYPNSKVNFVSNSGIYRIINLPIFISAGWLFATHGYPYYNHKHIRKNQHFIKVWHGCGFKDADSKLKNDKSNSIDNFEKILLVSDFFKKYMAPRWRWPQEKVIAKGFPRFDWLLTKTDEAKAFYRSFQKSQLDKILIWMPTFRNHISGAYNDNDDIKQFPIIYTPQEWKLIDDYCNKHNVVILVKLHPMQKNYDIPWQELSNVHLLTNEMLDYYDTNLYSFLSVTDGLISDYSSVTVDYMIVDKPIAFTLDDFYLYNKGRGFIIDNPLDYMPGHHLYNIEDMKIFIKDISCDCDKFKDNRKQLYDILLYRSGHYCADIVKELGIS